MRREPPARAAGREGSREAYRAVARRRRDGARGRSRKRLRCERLCLSKPKQIIIAGEPGAADTRAMLRLVHERFIPNKILLLADGGPAQQQLAERLPFLKSVSRKDGRATAYICENYVCQLPTADRGVTAQLLDGTWKPGSSQ